MAYQNLRSGTGGLSVAAVCLYCLSYYNLVTQKGLN